MFGVLKANERLIGNELVRNVLKRASDSIDFITVPAHHVTGGLAARISRGLV